MSKKPVHIVPNKNGGWDNKREGSTRASNHVGTKAEAIKMGRELAKKSETEHVIHNMDGKIGQKNSYGNDPFPPRG